MIPRMTQTYSKAQNTDPLAPCRAGTVGFRALGGLILALSLAPTLAGCTGVPETAVKVSVEYSAPLPRGEIALREVHDPATFRRLLEESYDPDDALLLEAGRLSARWFERPSVSSHYPVAGIDSELARDSLHAMLDLLERRLPMAQFVDEVMRRFALYESVGWDGRRFDCDFNQVEDLTVNSGSPAHIHHFKYDLLADRQIEVRDHCFACTAGAGSSCCGALTD